MPDTAMLDDARLGIGGNAPPEPIIDPINDPAPPSQSVLERWLASFRAALEIRNEATIARYAAMAAIERLRDMARGDG